MQHYNQRMSNQKPEMVGEQILAYEKNYASLGSNKDSQVMLTITSNKALYLGVTKQLMYIYQGHICG